MTAARSNRKSDGLERFADTLKQRSELRGAVETLSSGDLIGLSNGLLALACELPAGSVWHACAEEMRAAVNKELDAFATRYSSAAAVELRAAAKAVPA